VAVLTRLNGAIKIILNVIFVKVATNHLSGKSKLIHFPDKKFGLNDGLSVKKHSKKYQMKVENQLAHCKDYLNII